MASPVELTFGFPVVSDSDPLGFGFLWEFNEINYIPVRNACGTCSGVKDSSVFQNSLLMSLPPRILEVYKALISLLNTPHLPTQAKHCLFDQNPIDYEGMGKAEIKKNGLVAWSEDEVKLLKRLFPHGRSREIAEQTGRHLTAVRQKAYSMGIKTREWRLWSANEIKLLKKLYPSENTQSIADKLGRTFVSVSIKANLIGLKKAGTRPVWSRQEEALLRKLHPDNSIRDIANQLGRTVRAIVNKAQRLGLRKPKPVWSKKELNLLKKLYPSRTAQQIADQIGRSLPATRLKIVRLGLKKRKQKAKT